MLKTLYKLSKKDFGQKNTPEKFWVDRRTEYGVAFKKICQEKNIEVYSPTSETKAAVAERAIQSLKHIIYRCIEDHGKIFVPKMQHYVSTLICRKNHSVGKSFMRNTQPKFKIGDRVRVSKNNIPFRKKYKPQLTDKSFEFLTKSTKKPPTYISAKISKKRNSGELLCKKS